MEYKERINNLIREIEEKFSVETSVYQEWSEEEQEILNEKLTLIAEEIGVFESTEKKEEENIKNDLTIIDKNTGEKIELVDIINMKQRIKDVLKTNDMFSILRSVAVSNKCAHKCDNNYKGLQEQIKSIREEKKQYIRPIKSTINFNMESISKNDLEKLMQALEGTNIKRGAIISICRTLGIDIKDIKSNEEELNKIFYELKCQRRLILDKYEEQLIKKADAEQSYRESLFWIKDQLIAMIGQLLVNNVEYNKLDYEMIECGQDDFKNMLAIDYTELSYYIEVHMPNFIAEELIEEYNVKASVKSDKRSFEELGASAVYDRDDVEIERIREKPLSNVRRRILARPKRNTNVSKTYKFITKKIQNKKNVGIFEKKLRTEKDSTIKQIQYSKMRSDEMQIDIEERIIADSLDEVLREKDNLAENNIKQKNDFIAEIKSFARQEVIKGDKFDKVYYMYAIDKTENEFIKLIAYEKEISNLYKFQDRDYNIVEMIEFIKREVPKFEEKIEKYRKYNKEKGGRLDGNGDDGR